MSSATELREGAYTARWGNWMVGLRGRDGDWHATIWRWPPASSLAARIKIAARAGFPGALDAARWACEEMVHDGARVFVLGVSETFRFEDVLEFLPSPTSVDE